jgi:hypothetical protein
MGGMADGITGLGVVPLADSLRLPYLICLRVLCASVVNTRRRRRTAHLDI